MVSQGSKYTNAIGTDKGQQKDASYTDMEFHDGHAGLAGYPTVD